jgi:hypothetical protein
MNYTWLRTQEHSFTFVNGNSIVGKMRLASNELHAVAILQIGVKEVIIRKRGFWKSSFDLIDQSGKTIGTISNSNWFGSSMNFDLYGRHFAIVIRNNPMVEWAILESGKNVLAYGMAIDTNSGAVSVLIKQYDNEIDPLLHFVLWYFFHPIAQEQLGSGFNFQHGSVFSS